MKVFTFVLLILIATNAYGFWDQGERRLDKTSVLSEAAFYVLIFGFTQGHESKCGKQYSRSIEEDKKLINSLVAPLSAYYKAEELEISQFLNTQFETGIKGGSARDCNSEFAKCIIAEYNSDTVASKALIEDLITNKVKDKSLTTPPQCSGS